MFPSKLKFINVDCSKEKCQMRLYDNGRLIDGIRDNNNINVNALNNPQNNFNANPKIKIIINKNENHPSQTSIFDKNIDYSKDDILMKDNTKKKGNKWIYKNK